MPEDFLKLNLNWICTIDNRAGHTAILTPEGKIIIHGGSKIIANIFDASATPEIFVLNMEAEQFEFSEPPIVSNIGNETGAKSTNFPIIIIIYSVTGTLGAAMIVVSVIFIYRRMRTRNSNNKRNSVGHMVPEQVEFDNSGKIEEQHNLPGQAVPL
ncbi:2776_t:CDS:2 [Funneliformis caledonium]|uniref:2776_t:CDS:1 n=1 Tax=Funneliformis caledonium TaxID=1117310 RepID=A0A9N9B3F4_9GLOM|nr:2776_t:CDS:2 [Funneliformis caledonium]